MRLTVNRILSSSRNSLKSDFTNLSDSAISSPSASEDSSNLPGKLSQKHYNQPYLGDDRDVNDIINNVHGNRTRSTSTDNQTKNCSLKWLETRVTSQSIAIVFADKVGSILIVDPKMLRKKKHLRN